MPYQLKYFVITKMFPTDIAGAFTASHSLTTGGADAQVCVVVVHF